MAELLKGKPVADAIDEATLNRAEALKEKGITPTLAILRVGERPDDLSYEGRGVCGFVLLAHSAGAELLSLLEHLGTWHHQGGYGRRSSVSIRLGKDRTLDRRLAAGGA